VNRKLICIILIFSLVSPGFYGSGRAEAGGPASLVFGTTISAGDFHMSAVREDGTLWVWGTNAYGALGGEDKVDSAVPVKLLDNVSSTIAGTSGVYGAILQTGELWNWGIRGNNGRLGRQTTGWYIEPGKAMEKVRLFDMGHSHTVALKEDGSVWVWGDNQYGELGNGGNGLLFDSEWQQYRYEPLPGKVMTGIRFVEAGHRSTFAVDYEGTLWAWGNNEDGELGAGRTGNKTIYPLKGINTGMLCQTTPIRVMDQVKSVSSSRLTAIVKTDGSLWTCGEGIRDEQNHLSFDPVKVMDHVVSAAAGESEYAAVCEDGSLWTWGDNTYGQLGIGDDIDRAETPQKIMDDVVSVTVGLNFMAALKSDGSLWTWGANDYGQLGNGTKLPAFTPQKVMENVALPTAGNALRGTLDAGLREDWLSARFFNGNAYILYKNPEGTWDDAVEFCKNMGGHLATVSSAEEQRFIEQFSNHASVWLGGRGFSGTNWAWVTGESWKYDNWTESSKKKSASGKCYLALSSSGEWEMKSDNARPLGFICEWEGGADTSAVPSRVTCAVQFDPCFSGKGKSELKTRMKTGIPGEPYGTLPTPSQEGYYFEGWFSSKTGGKMITATSIIESQTNHTLYAHWTTAFNPPSVSDLSYAFGNSYSAFSYPNPYRIPLSQYIKTFGNTQTALDLYNLCWTWGGNCFGMSTTALMLFMDNEISARDFSSIATIPGQLRLSDRNSKLNLSLLDLIECVHISQLSRRRSQENSNNLGDYSGLVREVLDFRQNGTDPVIVEIRGPVRSDGSSGGHAVVALSVWRDEKKKKDVLQIYDPNFPGDNRRYIDLYWDQPGQYFGWYYYLNDKEHWGTGYGSDPLSFCRYSVLYSIWTDRGTADAYSATMITTNSSQAFVYDYDGNLLAEIRDGKLFSKSRDLALISRVDEKTASDSSENSVAFWAPEGFYYLVNRDPSVGEFTVSFSSGSGDRRMTVSTESSGIMGCVSDNADSELAFVDGLNRHYEILFSTPDGERNLSGVTDSEVASCFRLQSDQLFSSVPASVSDKALSNDSAGKILLASVSDLVSRTEPVTATSIFKDIKESGVLVPAVQWVWQKQIMSAVISGLFMPDRTCSVDDVITYIWRAQGHPETESGENASFAARAAILGIADQANSPEDLCTMDMFLTYLWQTLGEPGRSDIFSDYPDAWSWAEKTGLLNVLQGNPDPSALCTRADIAMLLYQVLE